MFKCNCKKQDDCPKDKNNRTYCCGKCPESSECVKPCKCKPCSEKQQQHGHNKENQ